MPKYIIITPARDEASHLENTILAVAGQTVRPAQWIIVNDGSVDSTASILERAAKEYDWVTVLHLPNRGFRKSGGGVVEAFNQGFKLIQDKNWDFIVKLDGDLSFAADYFERCFQHFEKDLGLGIGGGGIYHISDGILKLEAGPEFHVRGATKIYRKRCWESLDGLVAAPGWDTIDELKANMLGWNTRTFSDLRVLHHRFTGSADGAWKDSIKNGLANYVAGYHPIFMILKCVRRVAMFPYLIGSIGLAWGFCKGYLNRIPRVNDPALIAYTRSQQIKRLMRLDSIWS